MTTWTNDELNKIATADELQIAPVRTDGAARRPTTIWVVRHGDDLFIRSYRGRGGSWFNTAQASHQGHIRSGGVDKDVNLVEETDPSVNDHLDTAYRTKYRRHSSTYVDPMVAPDARAATLKLVPR
jgi:hypothetical protein